MFWCHWQMKIHGDSWRPHMISASSLRILENIAGSMQDPWEWDWLGAISWRYVKDLYNGLEDPWVACGIGSVEDSWGSCRICTTVLWILDLAGSVQQPWRFLRILQGHWNILQNLLVLSVHDPDPWGFFSPSRLFWSSRTRLIRVRGEEFSMTKY